ncbi:probable E3 ubiquitin-protein ligase RNF144A-B isoform X2 [Electrophorus electricus]|uniref:probable E3 ubiquitin-protein ligase RNF144A-B isoform X2 n=1 Tax=Electrophorus electricus TaxID=8005 RepID=UPI0015CFBBB3|nr:probable E3 ubiquitin-protein ligase RNF144A-B isoform X2 [Electrophorus electricus]
MDRYHMKTIHGPRSHEHIPQGSAHPTGLQALPGTVPTGAHEHRLPVPVHLLWRVFKALHRAADHRRPANGDHLPRLRLSKTRRTAGQREVLLDPCRTWCPSSSCQAVCQLKATEASTAQLVQCPDCSLRFCSACQADWHGGEVCQESLPVMTFESEDNGSMGSHEEDEALIKRCPKCKVYIERDEGCAQMMCTNCKHAFCWYCLESLDDDFLLTHYDKGPCRKKLGHSRVSVIWHRTQVVGIFAGFGLLLLVASPFLLLAMPFILCCKCNCRRQDDNL